jgi:glucose-1-phosphate thymidylyltransferase
MVEKDIRTKNEYQLTDALQLMLDKGEKFLTSTIEGWYDCGKTETMLSTNRYLLSKNKMMPKRKGCVIIPPVFIAADAKVKNSVIGPNTTVASGAIVKNSIVRESIISDGAEVNRILLNESIIGNNAVVKGNFARLNVGNSSEINYK